MRRAVLIAAGLLALAIAWTVTIGQAQALVTLLLAIGSPWAVAVAANIKVFPALVAVYWVGRREWGRLRVFAAWMLGLIAVQFVVEPAATLDYIGFLSLEQVGQVNSFSLYALSPVLWAASVVILGLLALRLAATRWGWPAAIALSVFATPRLLTYQLSTLLAALGGPDRRNREASDTVAPAVAVGRMSGPAVSGVPGRLPQMSTPDRTEPRDRAARVQRGRPDRPGSRRAVRVPASGAASAAGRCAGVGRRCRSEVEVLVIDDGSTDGTAAIVAARPEAAAEAGGPARAPGRHGPARRQGRRRPGRHAPRRRPT